MYWGTISLYIFTSCLRFDKTQTASKNIQRYGTPIQQSDQDGFRSKFEQLVQKLFTKNLLTAH